MIHSQEARRRFGSIEARSRELVRDERKDMLVHEQQFECPSLPIDRPPLFFFPNLLILFRLPTENLGINLIFDFQIHSFYVVLLVLAIVKYYGSYHVSVVYTRYYVLQAICAPLLFFLGFDSFE